MSYKFVFLYTDAILWILLGVLVYYLYHVSKNELLINKWKKFSANALSLSCAAILSIFFVIALLDSVHFRLAIDQPTSTEVAYSPRTYSLLDYHLEKRLPQRERSYSSPFAIKDFDKTTVTQNEEALRINQRLQFAGTHATVQNHLKVVMLDILKAISAGLFCAFLFLLAINLFRKYVAKEKKAFSLPNFFFYQHRLKPFVFVWMGGFFLLGFIETLLPLWHICGTDAVGNDILYCAIKSIRTALVIGTLSTLCMLPLAITLGILAGYFKGWVDDIIQYLYTTITSIPSVLLISASVLMIQVFIDKNPYLYETSLERADLRLFLLSFIIGITSWSGLARLLRAETFKLSAMDFVTAARAFGVSPFKIMFSHILPNAAHIVLIVCVLDFSGIVLYEAILSYVGVGVDPTMNSFGTMINAAAIEMSRSPVIWWNLLTSFLFMFTLVLSANLFASGVREAFDPKTQNGGSRA